ncbi:hypothetical protein F4553_005148 [Allocatelliglobosispora scoriae]|uniref:DUF4097 domain-containing protein n=1 Tax=Allocatelliglobosispora scoriae TaxID=643052 RepID=A0A841BX96_9ACTN|nr:DUF4097 family beta strand repeat-containing protein [Allocatelliglobosispora scoriae]MBB5871769.1 hypothetical protein [Allocatelliglobosispora scoriae]
MTSSPWRALGTAFTIVALLIGGLVAWSFVGRPDPQSEHQEQTYQHAITKIVFEDVDSGNVHVSASPATEEVAIDRYLKWSRSKPTYTERWDGDTLRIKLHCDDNRWWWGDDCSIDYAVKVPTDIAVEIDATSGDLDVLGTKGAVKITATSGDVKIGDVTGPISVTLTSGDLTTADLIATDFEADLTSGDLLLDFAAAPHSLDARVTSGDVDIAVPRADYRVSVDTGSGDQRVGVPDTAGATNKITLRSTSGDVALSYR